MINGGTKILFHGEALFHAGQKARYFYLVRRGSINIVDQAGTAICREFSADELFGIPEVLAYGSWDLSAVAYGLNEVQLFPAERLFNSLSEMPEPHSDFLCRVGSSKSPHRCNSGHIKNVRRCNAHRFFHHCGNAAAQAHLQYHMTIELLHRHIKLRTERNHVKARFLVFGSLIFFINPAF